MFWRGATRASSYPSGLRKHEELEGQDGGAGGDVGATDDSHLRIGAENDAGAFARLAQGDLHGRRRRDRGGIEEEGVVLAAGVFSDGEQPLSGAGADDEGVSARERGQRRLRREPASFTCTIEVERANAHGFSVRRIDSSDDEGDGPSGDAANVRRWARRAGVTGWNTGHYAFDEGGAHRGVVVKRSWRGHVRGRLLERAAARRDVEGTANRGRGRAATSGDEGNGRQTAIVVVDLKDLGGGVASRARGTHHVLAVADGHDVAPGDIGELEAGRRHGGLHRAIGEVEPGRAAIVDEQD